MSNITKATSCTSSDEDSNQENQKEAKVTGTQEAGLTCRKGLTLQVFREATKQENLDKHL